MKKARRFLSRCKGELIRTLYQIFHPAQVNEINGLSDLSAKIPRIRIPKEALQIRGLIWPDEQRALYALGAMAESPLLEVGAWMGLSTVCLAAGIRASGKPKEFITCELNPSMANIRELPDGQIGLFYPPDSDVAMGTCSREIFERDIKPVITHPEGIAGQLSANLRRANFDTVVQVKLGDFRSTLPDRKFGFIFSDTMHDPEEIRRNAPDLLRFVMDGTILACHDATPENVNEIGRYFQFTESIQINTLFIGKVRLPH